VDMVLGTTVQPCTVKVISYCTCAGIFVYMCVCVCVYKFRGVDWVVEEKSWSVRFEV